MDAKPQRPRTLRVRADENAPVEQAKTIHSRFKSTSALPSIPSIGGNGPGGLKATAKRTAFGDVSNTVRNQQQSKEDGKYGKAVVAVGAAPLAKPAQRPVKPVEAAPKVPAPALQPIQPAQPTQALLQPVQTRTLVKSKTTVFKDTTEKPVPSSQTNLRPRHHKSQPYLKQALVPEPAVEVIEEREVVEKEVQIRDRSSDTIEEEFVSAEEGVSAENVHYEPERPVVQPEQYPSLQEQIVSEHDQLLEEAKQTVAASAILPPVSELQEPAGEEYWDEEDEEDDEGYDDEGYTTARSYRSRGDTTTVLFPKFTARVRRELLAAQQVVEQSRPREDVVDESWDTSMVAEYGEEIFEYMHELEVKMLPNAHYMDNQSEIQWSMRSVLMDWLVQVHHRFGLLPETLFLCVNYIDRFLSSKIVSLGKLQLVGATAIFVAAKYEEINCPSVQEIVYMVDSGYTVDEILKAERFMLSMLHFELGWPGPMSFLRRISKADEYDLETRTLAKYFLEVTIMDERFVGCPPSFTAAGAHCLARLMLGKGDWSPQHVHYAGYTYSQLRPLLAMILDCCASPEQHHGAVYDKYADRRFKRASVFVQSEVLKGWCLPGRKSVGSVSASSFGPAGTGTAAGERRASATENNNTAASKGGPSVPLAATEDVGLVEHITVPAVHPPAPGMPPQHPLPAVPV